MDDERKTILVIGTGFAGIDMAVALELVRNSHLHDIPVVNFDNMTPHDIDELIGNVIVEKRPEIPTPRMIEEEYFNICAPEPAQEERVAIKKEQRHRDAKRDQFGRNKRGHGGISIHQFRQSNRRSFR